jgi:6-pyruvoyltetrahydropterin/6-carboxytetrahydropterin synthase
MVLSELLSQLEIGGKLLYTLSLKRDFIAQHYLIGGDWGAENQKHSHHYILEVELSGPSLNPHNYLLDIVELEDLLEKLVAGYRDRCLNDLPEFAGQNPSLELFAQHLCKSLASQIKDPNLQEINLRLWENQMAWASYRQAL